VDEAGPGWQGAPRRAELESGGGRHTVTVTAMKPRSLPFSTSSPLQAGAPPPRVRGDAMATTAVSFLPGAGGGGEVQEQLCDNPPEKIPYYHLN
jgi:hypothetical protein